MDMQELNKANRRVDTALLKGEAPNLRDFHFVTANLTALFEREMSRMQIEIDKLKFQVKQLTEK